MPTSVKSKAAAKKGAGKSGTSKPKASSIASSLATYLKERAPGEDIAAYDAGVLDLRRAARSRGVGRAQQGRAALSPSIPIPA